MRNIQLLKLKDYKPLKWKNGKGTTAEIAISPPEAAFNEGNFKWRVSTAPVVENGSFSQFPDHDRCLIILTGQGVRLNGLPIAPLVVHTFSGADETYCELIEGSVTDLSVFVRRGSYYANVEILEVDRPFRFESKSVAELFYIVKGQLRIANGSVSLTAEERDSILMRDSSSALQGAVDACVQLAGVNGPTLVARISIMQS